VSETATTEPAAAAAEGAAALADAAGGEGTMAPVSPAPEDGPDGGAASAQEMEAVLEAILFVAGEPQPRERLLELFGRQERAAAETALQAVLDRYRGGEGRGMMVEEVAGGVRLVSRPELHTYLRRFFQVSGRGRLSMAALETLASVASLPPLTGPEIGDLRGVQSTAVIKTLLERRLIRIAGRKQVVGKPFLYATTREFLLHFGLGTLADLPPLEEMEELFAIDGGDGAVLTDREEEVLRANAELDAREAAREAPEEEG
jgi:segregation and condensation protein B